MTVRAGSSEVAGQRGREVFLIKDPEAAVYGMASTWRSTGSAVHRSGELLVAGDAGSDLIAAPLDRSRFVRLLVPRTERTRRRWRSAFAR